MRAGQHIRIVNTHGTQVVDTWAFSAGDVTEWMAMEASRAWFMKLAAAVGDSFVTNRRRPILTLVEDTSGVRARHAHGACDAERYGLLGVRATTTTAATTCTPGSPSWASPSRPRRPRSTCS